METTILFIRVSSVQQITNNSITAQNIAVRSAAQTIFSAISDCHKITQYEIKESSEKNRVFFNLMLKQAIECKANIVVFSVDRFSRESREKASEHLTKLLVNGCKIHFVSENITLDKSSDITSIITEIERAAKELKQLKKVKAKVKAVGNIANLKGKNGKQQSKVVRQKNKAAKLELLRLIISENPNISNAQIIVKFSEMSIKVSKRSVISWKNELQIDASAKKQSSVKQSSVKRKYTKKQGKVAQFESKVLSGYEPKNASEKDRELFFKVINDIDTNKSKAQMLNELGFKPCKANSFNENILKKICRYHKNKFAIKTNLTNFALSKTNDKKVCKQHRQKLQKEPQAI